MKIHFNNWAEFHAFFDEFSKIASGLGVTSLIGIGLNPKDGEFYATFTL